MAVVGVRIVPIAAALTCCAFSALGGEWRVKTWSASDGLPQGVVYAIHHTRDRYRAPRRTR